MLQKKFFSQLGLQYEWENFLSSILQVPFALNTGHNLIFGWLLCLLPVSGRPLSCLPLAWSPYLSLDGLSLVCL